MTFWVSHTRPGAVAVGVVGSTVSWAAMAKPDPGSITTSHVVPSALSPRIAHTDPAGGVGHGADSRTTESGQSSDRRRAHIRWSHLEGEHSPQGHGLRAGPCAARDAECAEAIEQRIRLGWQ